MSSGPGKLGLSRKEELDAARLEEFTREASEAEWHKVVAARMGQIMVAERFRRVIGPALG